MSDNGRTIAANLRYLVPGEGKLLTDAIRAAYGETYDVRWVYDTDEVEARLEAGTYVSAVAESADGELLCHEGMSLAAAGDRVAHSGQAVTLPQARGQHLFTRTKRFLMDGARERGLAGMYSEATAAHPFSQRANLELGAHETGFLLGWIPASVENDAASASGERRARRQSAALFYTKLNDGEERTIYAPPRHRQMIDNTVAMCQLRGTVSDPPASFKPAERTELHIEIEADHGLALITVLTPGRNLEDAIGAERHHLFHHQNLDAVYVDLPLDDPATALLADLLRPLGLSYAGVFPNRKANGDVLRLQSMHRARITAEDVSVASEHGQALLDYVLTEAAGNP
ncbi:MAG TPA: hypothetical protein VFY04_08955 [Solirubrobacterales bacterium]|nr:hypothetical protein [Solirubrobacterales bacterium]